MKALIEPETQITTGATMYALRAANQPDIDRLLQKIPARHVINWRVAPVAVNFPDRFLAIELTGMSLNDLKAIIRQIPDSYVMLETVATAQDYTGKR